MLKKALIFKLLSVTLMLCSAQVEAKDMTSRLGVGFRNAYSMDLPSVAAIYYPSAQYGVVGAVGVDTQENASKSAFSIGLRRILFFEDNMNFFMGGQLTMLSRENALSETESGFELGALIGAEFYFAGLENLGFSFESGVAVTNVKKTRFRTVGDHPFRAGVIFYF